MAIGSEMKHSCGSAVIVDQTAVCESSRLLDHAPVGREFGFYLGRGLYSGIGLQYRTAIQSWWLPSNEERLIELSALLDAILLYENLFVLASENPPDGDRLTLRSALLDRGILRVLDTRPYSHPISSELESFLANAHSTGYRLDTWHSLADPRAVAQTVRACLELSTPPSGWSSHYEPKEDLAEGLRGALEGVLADRWLVERVKELEREYHKDPLRALALELLDHIGYFESGSVIAGISHLRTFVYWRLSEHANMPFSPSLRRLAEYHRMTEYVRESAQERVYGAVADAFRSTVSEVFEGEQPAILYLPPALALFLETFRRGKDITKSVDHLREEYAPLRKMLAKYQEDISNSATLGQARTAKRKFNESLTRISEKFDNPHPAFVNQALDIVPSVASMAADPLNVEKYAENLVQRPVEWLRNWWLNRPLSPIFKLRDHLLALRDYGNLLQEATGIALQKEQIGIVLQNHVKTNTLFRHLGRIPGADPTDPHAE
ncbi:hypothetical protein [Streptomyces sp. Ru71]|uniref:hypothetical protein n=1 Tax=Streptomyces sp. Ru71 TaxID=2080746 RepID=UPI0011AFDF37|nr:hypothetical protein [Streptomyces sp. Ru71]